MSLKQRQRYKLSSTICTYCNEKIVGDRDYHCYHNYICHPDRIREIMINNLKGKSTGRYKDLDHMIDEFVHLMQKIHERERKLV